MSPLGSAKEIHPAVPREVQTIVDDLLRVIEASRIDLRLDVSGQTFPVVAEALAPGVRSMLRERSIDLRAAATFQYLEREKLPVVQRDVYNADLQLPSEVIDFYGVRAQMLVPIVRHERLAGFIAVAYTLGPREWSEADLSAVERAADQIGRALDEDDWWSRHGVAAEV